MRRGGKGGERTVLKLKTTAIYQFNKLLFYLGGKRKIVRKALVSKAFETELIFLKLFLKILVINV